MKNSVIVMLSLLLASCASKPDPADYVVGAAREVITRSADMVSDRENRAEHGPGRVYLEAIKTYQLTSTYTNVIQAKSASRQMTKVSRGGKCIQRITRSDHDHDGIYEELLEEFRVSNETVVAITDGPRDGAGVYLHSSPGISVTLRDINRDGKNDEILIMGEEPFRFVEMFRYTNDAWRAISAEQYYEAIEGAKAVAPLFDATTDVIKNGKANPNHPVQSTGKPAPNR